MKHKPYILFRKLSAAFLATVLCRGVFIVFAYCSCLAWRDYEESWFTAIPYCILLLYPHPDPFYLVFNFILWLQILPFFQILQFVFPLVNCPLNGPGLSCIEYYSGVWITAVFSQVRGGLFGPLHRNISKVSIFFLTPSVLSRWHVTAVASQLILSPQSLRAFCRPFPWTHNIWQNARKKLYVPSESHLSCFLSLFPERRH